MCGMEGKKSEDAALVRVTDSQVRSAQPSPDSNQLSVLNLSSTNINVAS